MGYIVFSLSGNKMLASEVADALHGEVGKTYRYRSIYKQER